MKNKERLNKIIQIVESNAGNSISAIKILLDENISTPTLNRNLASLVSNDVFIKTGKGRNTVYQISPHYRLLNHELGDSYFDKEPDYRNGYKKINPEVLKLLKPVSLFNQNEIGDLKIFRSLSARKLKLFRQPS